MRRDTDDRERVVRDAVGRVEDEQPEDADRDRRRLTKELPDYWHRRRPEGPEFISHSRAYPARSRHNCYNTKHDFGVSLNPTSLFRRDAFQKKDGTHTPGYFAEACESI